MSEVCPNDGTHWACEHVHQPTTATDDLVAAIWRLLSETGGSEAWVHDTVRNGIRSWRAAHRNRPARIDGGESDV